MRSPKVLCILHEAKASQYISVRLLLQYDPLRTYFTPIYVVRPSRVVQHEVKESVLVLATTLTRTCGGKDSFTPGKRTKLSLRYVSPHRNLAEGKLIWASLSHAVRRVHHERLINKLILFFFNSEQIL
jgi:hypothetical protein